MDFDSFRWHASRIGFVWRENTMISSQTCPRALFARATQVATAYPFRCVLAGGHVWAHFLLHAYMDTCVYKCKFGIRSHLRIAGWKRARTPAHAYAQFFVIRSRMLTCCDAWIHASMRWQGGASMYASSVATSKVPNSMREPNTLATISTRIIFLHRTSLISSTSAACQDIYSLHVRLAAVPQYNI